ncbi:MAG: flavodoxin domain-containing protein [Clostridia bacterium]|nr:flavodoxin domain-containing protein [Clostridia bacterium]
MKTLIVYASRYGYTSDCVTKLAGKLHGEVTTVNIDKEKTSDLEQYDNIVIGGSVKIGKIQKSVIQFCETNKVLLLKKKVAFFISCGDQNHMQYLNGAIPEELLTHALSVQSFGGEFKTDKMNFIEKKMIDMIKKSTVKEGKSLPVARYENIDIIAEAINQ